MASPSKRSRPTTPSVVALIGAASGNVGPDAAIGAGAGLLGGAFLGATQAPGAGYEVQRRYDNAYQQCMYAKGNQIPAQVQASNRRSARWANPPPPPPPPTYTSKPANVPPSAAAVVATKGPDRAAGVYLWQGDWNFEFVRFLLPEGKFGITLKVRMLLRQAPVRGYYLPF
jgi:hypothetical protein